MCHRKVVHIGEREPISQRQEKIFSQSSSNNHVRMKVLPLLSLSSSKRRGLLKNKPIEPCEFDMCAEERSGKWPRKKGNERGEILPEEINGRKERDGVRHKRGGGQAGGEREREWKREKEGRNGRERG